MIGPYFKKKRILTFKQQEANVTAKLFRSLNWTPPPQNDVWGLINAQSKFPTNMWATFTVKNTFLRKLFKVARTIAQH